MSDKSTESTGCVLHVSDFTFPSASLLKTILAHLVVQDGLFDLFASSHDEWT